MTRPLSVPEIFAKLESTSGKNDKIEILKEHKDNDIFRLVVEKALDPFNIYYMKQIPEHKFTNNSVVKLDRVVQQLDRLSSRQKTGNDAKLFVQQILSQLSEADGDIVQRVITKDLKSGVAASTVNAAWGKGSIPTFDVMLCSKYTEKNIAKLTWPVCVQEKMDGMRVIFKVTQSGVDVYSRSGKDLGLSDLFRSELFHLAYADNLNDTKAYVFDGELMVKEKNGSYMARKKANGILNKAIKGTCSEEEKQDIYAVVWDILPTSAFELGEYDITYASRYAYLHKRFNSLTNFKDERRMELLPSTICSNMDEVLEIYNDFISKGSEGVVVKDLSSGWKNKRVPHHIKMKIEESADLEIKEVVGGEGKYSGMLGNFILESKCGKLRVSVGSGFSDAQRTEYFTEDMVGKIVEIKYNEIISSQKADVKSLFLPIFLNIRDDKKTADTLAKLEK